jgi:hydrogenase-4 component F
MVNNALVKGVLFLAAGNINRRFASKRREEVSGVIGILPVTAMLFIAAFLAVTGSPPFGLFVSEFSILREVFATGHFALGGYFLIVLSVVFIGMGSTILAVTLGPPSARADSAPYHDTVLSVGPPLILLLLVLVLGLYLPESIRSLVAEAAGIVEVPR